MVNFLKVVAILLLVLPALISATCQLSVESRLEDTQNRYNIYRATVHNVGDAAAADIKLTTPADIRRVSGLKSCDDGYSLPRDAIKDGGIAAGDSYSFKYKVRKGTNVIFTASCESDEETTTTQPPTAPTTRPKATTTTTRRSSGNKKATTTTTKKAATTTTTTKAPAQQTTTTTTKAPTTTTTKAPAQTTTTTQKAATTTTTKKATTTTTTKAPTTTTTKQATVTTTTTKPASGTGKKCSGNTWWSPSPMTTWQWQLTGTIDTSFNVQVYDIDLFDNSADTIAKLHSQGRAVICYFSTQYENWRPDASSFPSSVLGKNLDDWAGEKYVDIRSPIVRAAMKARMELAVSKGCDAVEPDNVDGYQASTGFPITAADQLSYNQYLANTAHSLGLSIGLKNDGDQAKALQPYFDWALNEQCNQYSECDDFNTFISAGKAVFVCEYSGSSSSVCPKMNAAKMSTIFKSLDLNAKINTQCCSSASGGCSAVAPSSCVSSSGARTVPADELLQEETVAQEQVAEARASSASTTYLAAAAAFAAVVALAL